MNISDKARILRATIANLNAPFIIEEEIQSAFDAIEAEAFKRGQESMRERAIMVAADYGHHGAIAAGKIRELPILETTEK